MLASMRYDVIGCASCQINWPVIPELHAGGLVSALELLQSNV